MIKYSEEAAAVKGDDGAKNGGSNGGDEILASGFTEAQIRNLFYQLVQGLHACHSKGIPLSFAYFPSLSCPRNATPLLPADSAVADSVVLALSPTPNQA